MTSRVCPTCKRPIGPWKPRRICSRRKKAMGRSDKWQFLDNGKIAHRDCKDPGGYPPKE